MTDRVEDILRATGRRPEVPRESAARVAAVVRAHWQSDLRRRRFRKNGALALGWAAVAAGIVLGLRLWDGIASVDATPMARVEAVVDSAWSRSGAPKLGATAALRPGETLLVGSELATMEHARVALRMSTGHSLRLDERTRARLVSPRAIVLESGAIYVDSRGPGGPAREPIEIRTPFGAVREIGTQFEVRWVGDAVRVRVREGEVVLGDGPGAIEMAAGTEAVVRDGGVVERHTVAPFGSEWDWISGLAPVPSLEGRSVREFLDWVARERGLAIRFETSELAASAPRFLLRGSIEGMSIDQALESVLPTCRMSHRVEGDTLVIRGEGG